MASQTSRERLFLYRGICTVIIGLVFGFIGPFRTFTYLSPSESLFYWILPCLFAWSHIEGGLFLVTNWGPLKGRHLLLRAAAASILAAVPVACEIMAVELILGVSIILPSPNLSLSLIAVVYFRTTYLSLLVTLPWAMLWRSFAGFDIWQISPLLKSAMETTPTPQFLRTLSHPRGPLWAIAQEHNCLRLYFKTSSELVLYRLSDAIAELGPQTGLQVHRYWWVDYSAIHHLSRYGQTAELTLKNGLRIPVGRTYLPALQHAGWHLRETSNTATERQKTPSNAV